MIESLPQVLDSRTDLYFAIEKFRAHCDKEYFEAVKGAPKQQIALTIVICGRYDKFAGARSEPHKVPFLVIISNCHDNDPGRRGQVMSHFTAQSGRILTNKRTGVLNVCRGDLSAASKRNRERHTMFRHLRRGISASLKVKLAASYIQSVSAVSNGRVGDEVLGIAYAGPNESTMGFDLSPRDDTRRQKTMPHMISDGGGRAMNFTVKPITNDDRKKYDLGDRKPE